MAPCFTFLSFWLCIPAPWRQSPSAPLSPFYFSGIEPNISKEYTHTAISWLVSFRWELLSSCCGRWRFSCLASPPYFSSPLQLPIRLYHKLFFAFFFLSLYLECSLLVLWQCPRWINHYIPSYTIFRLSRVNICLTWNICLVTFLCHSLMLPKEAK